MATLKPKSQSASMNQPNDRRANPQPMQSGSLNELQELRELSKLLQKLAKQLQQGKVTPEEEKQTESWLDSILSSVKKYAPMAIELAPELLALL
jgi:predicted ATPase